MVHFRFGPIRWPDRCESAFKVDWCTVQPYRSFFRKFLSEVEKCIMWSSVLVLPNQVSKKSFYAFEDMDLWESHAKLHEKPSETLGADPILKLEISIYCLPRNFNWFPLYFAQCSFTKMKRTLQNESLPKDTGQELLTVNKRPFGPLWLARI